MTSYQVEPWSSFKLEAAGLFVRHWNEVALNHTEVPLDIDEDKYDELADDGKLHIVTVRRNGRLVGYHLTIVAAHLHYKSTLHGFTDVYWIAPECRHGIVGLRMFQHVDNCLKAFGVRKRFTAVKLHMHLDQGRLLEYLGYQPVERLYSKLI